MSGDVLAAHPNVSIAHPEVLGGVFLIQKEVADKIKTDAKKKSYLRWLLNYAYDIEYLFTVPPEDFSPPPKVESAVIRLKLKAESGKQKIDYNRMIAFLDIVSMYKRKTLSKIAKLRKEDLEKLDIQIPEKLQEKRLEALGREEMEEILIHF